MKDAALLAGLFSLVFVAGCERKPVEGCEIDGKPIRAANNTEIAGKTSTIRCRNAGGMLLSEDTVRNGKWVGSRKLYYPVERKTDCGPSKAA